MLWFNSKDVSTYWWRGTPNFGDELAPHLLKRFAGLKPTWAPVSKANLVTVGSILEHIPPLWDGYVLGSGKLYEDSRLYIQSTRILALRGPLSARGLKGSFAIGDPGLLADELVGPQEKVWELGIIPHWRDRHLEVNPRRWCPKPHAFVVIPHNLPPLEFLSRVGACKRIITSSLHGAIVADAFGIPRRIEECRALAKEGSTFKFRDYHQSIRLPFRTGKMQAANRYHVEDRQFELYDVYREFGRAWRKNQR